MAVISVKFVIKVVPWYKSTLQNWALTPAIHETDNEEESLPTTFADVDAQGPIHSCLISKLETNLIKEKRKKERKERGEKEKRKSPREAEYVQKQSWVLYFIVPISGAAPEVESWFVSL